MVCLRVVYYILDISNEKIVKYRPLDYKSSVVLPHIDSAEGKPHEKGMKYPIRAILFILILVVFNHPNLFQSSLNTKEKPNEVFFSSLNPNLLKSNTNKRHSQLFNSVLASSHLPSNEVKDLPDKNTSSNSSKPIPIDDTLSSNSLSTEKMITENNITRINELSNIPSVDFQPIDSSSSTFHNPQSSSSITPPSQSEEAELSHPSTHNDLPINFTSSSSSHRRWIPTRPSHLGSLDVWKEYLRKYRSTHIKLSKSSQKVMYLKRGTTGIAGQMIGVCDSLLIAMMTNRGLQCRLT